jgi:DNA-binding NarL/FixJ family response regulator
MDPIAVALVDDHRVVGASLKAFLESFPDIHIVGAASSGEELLARLADWQPAVVVQDLLLPGGIDGVETTRRIVQAAPSTRVVVLTASMDEARMVGALRAGAAGYVRKDADPEDLVTAIRAVARGKTYLDPSVGRPAVVGGRRRDELTQRELDILGELARGRTNKAIAGTLGVTEATVKTHVASLLWKLGAANRTEAVVEALKQGLIGMQELE